MICHYIIFTSVEDTKSMDDKIAFGGAAGSASVFVPNFFKR